MEVEQVSITEADILEAERLAFGLEEVVEDPEARTVREWARRHNIGKDRMRALVDQAVAEGKMELVRVRRRKENGHFYTLEVYRFTE